MNPGDPARLPSDHLPQSAASQSQDRPTSSSNAFFSPQTAFYASPDPAATGIERISNNPLFHMGMKAVGEGMKDITSKTAHMLPTEMRKSLSSIRYYFAVDQSYVLKKLCLLLFPFRSRNWSLGYSADEPVPPRADTNAPDYYIPLMSAITYVLIAGLVLGTQNRFTPEQLGMHATSILIWNTIEVCLLCLACYILNVQSKLRTLDLIAYCGYKYVGMIAILASYLATHSTLICRGALVYVSITLCYFLIKCLRLQILPDTSATHVSHRNERRVYLLLVIVFIQPLFIWYLTRHLIVI